MKKDDLQKATASRQQFVKDNLSDGQANPLSQTPRRPALTNGLVVHVLPTIAVEGDVIKSTIQKDQVRNADGTLGNAFFGYQTKEEVMITTGQIARRGNGLGLKGETVDEMLDDFEAKVMEGWEKNKDNADYPGVPVQVVELRTRPGRNGLQTIPQFKW